MKKFILFASILSLIASPQLTVVLIIDSFASHHIEKLQPYLHHGLKTFLDKGTWFKNVSYPHGCPITAPGHASLSTGTCPKDNGIFATSWIKHGKKIAIQEALPQKLRKKTLNEFFVEQNPHHYACSFSLKNYAALLMAGKKTPALWFNSQTLQFTGNSLSQESLDAMNKTNQYLTQISKKSLSWNLAHTDQKYYTFPHINNYKHLRQKSYINKLIKKEDPLFSEIFIRSPQTNQILLNLSLDYLERTIQKKPKKIMLWISLSSLDQVTHYFGPQSKETIDTIYHLDHYIKSFMNKVSQLISPDKTLYVLTADHGFMKLPELRNPPQKSFVAPDIQNEINQKLYKKYNQKNIIEALKTPFIYINNSVLKIFSQQKQIQEDIKKELKKHPAIASVYESKKLLKNNYKPTSKKWLFKNLIYLPRCGSLIFKVKPNIVIKNAPNKTTHNTPYEENLHVPLIFYQPSKHKGEIITEPFWTPQLAATLANILKIKSFNKEAFPPLPFALS